MPDPRRPQHVHGAAGVLRSEAMSRVLAPFMRLRPFVRGAVAAVVAAAVIVGAAGAAAAGGGGGGTHHITAYFTRVIGLYKGNDVRILGVRVGEIDSLKVMGQVVQV